MVENICQMEYFFYGCRAKNKDLNFGGGGEIVPKSKIYTGTQ